MTNTTAHYTSFGRRFIALFLDALILALPCAITAQAIPFLGAVLIFIFYAPIFECSRLRATPGKYWMGIEVADLQEERISFQVSLIRNIAKLFSSALFFLGYVVALFTSKKQSLHDLLANTVVIYGRHEYSVVDAWVETIREVFGSKIFKNSTDPLSKLERLQILREKNALTEEEFQKEKDKLL